MVSEDVMEISGHSIFLYLWPVWLRPRQWLLCGVDPNEFSAKSLDQRRIFQFLISVFRRRMSARAREPVLRFCPLTYTTHSPLQDTPPRRC